MHIVGVIPIEHPLLQLSPSSHLHRRKLGYALLQVCGKGSIYTQHTCRGDDSRPKVEHQLVVHGATCCRGSLAFTAGMYILGRVTGANHQPTVHGLFHHRLIKEHACLFHNGVSRAQKRHIACVKVSFPQVTAQPCPTRWPHARRCFIECTRYAPYIRIVMQHPAIGTIHGFSRFASGFTHLLNQLKERFIQFAEVGYLGRPIVHFEVDVARIFTVPRREEFVIPDALKISRLSARLRRTDQQVSAEFEVGSYQERIIRILETFHTHVCCYMGKLIVAQVQRRPIHELTEVSHVSFHIVGIGTL